MLSETPKPKRVYAPLKLKGLCPDCGKLVRIMPSGVLKVHPMRNHRGVEVRCTGSRKPPEKR